MSSARWPAGTLSAALRAAHKAAPFATAPDLARMVDCDPGSARVVLRGMGIIVPPAKVQRITWTPEMKQALIDGATNHRSMTLLAEDMGVCPTSLVLGALEVIRDLVSDNPPRQPAEREAMAA